MNIEPKELLVRMKQYDFIYDSKLGQVVNKFHEEDKEYIFKMLDLLYENYDRVRYIDDMGESKGRYALLVSQKFALADKRVPIPQVPFSFQYNGKPYAIWRAKIAYYLLIGIMQETDEEICVSLNFKDEKYRKVFKQLTNKKKTIV